MAERNRNATVSIGAGTSTELASELFGAQRAMLSITNLNAVGGDTVFISIGQEAKANTGQPISPGQTFMTSIDSAFKPSNMKFNGYSTGASTVSILEMIFEKSR